MQWVPTADLAVMAERRSQKQSYKEWKDKRDEEKKPGGVSTKTRPVGVDSAAAVGSLSAGSSSRQRLFRKTTASNPSVDVAVDAESSGHGDALPKKRLKRTVFTQDKSSTLESMGSKATASDKDV